MKIQRKLNANTLVECEAPTMGELFEQLSQLEEIFRTGPCGLCRGTAIGFRTREVSGIKFHEAVCQSCGAAFTYGTKKAPAGVLFPQRRDAAGSAKPNGGWVKWVPATNGGGSQE